MKHKDFYANKLPWRKLRILMACVWGFAYWGFGQAGGNSVPIQFCGSYHALPPNGTNPDSLITDRFGNVFDIEELLLPIQPVNPVENCIQAGHFNITYFGELPEDASEVICQALTDFSSILQQRTSNGTCPLTSQKIELAIAWIKFSDPDQDVVDQLQLQLPLPSNAGGIGSPFYSPPGNPNCKEVTLDRPFIKMNGGNPNPGTGIFDGRILFNDDYNWNFNASLQTGQFPGFVDLYSVVLHELMHVMGYASRMPAPDFYSLWDQTLRVVNNYEAGGGGSNPQKVIFNPSDCVSNCWQTSSNFNSLISNSCSDMGPDIVIGDGAIAPINGNPNINPNDPNIGGVIANLLSHLSPTCSNQNENYVMQSLLTDNVARRQMTDAEQRIFCELGYLVNSPTFICDGCYAISHIDYPDFIDPPTYCCPKVYYSCVGGKIHISKNDLLCNDISNSDREITELVGSHIPNLQIIPQGDGWDLSFLQPSTDNFERFTIYYTLKGCEADCRMHYQEVKIHWIFDNCLPCIEEGPCENLLCVRDFENFNAHPIFAKHSFFGHPIWIEGYDYVGTPTVRKASDGNTFLQLPTSNPSNFFNPDIPVTGKSAVTLKLNQCVEPGCDLKLEFDVSDIGDPGGELEIWGSNQPPCSALESPLVPIANSCTTPTPCSSGYLFDPICISHLAGLSSGTLVNPNLQPAFPNGPLIWRNVTSQAVCHLTLIPFGANRAILAIDNITAQLHSEPEVTCNVVPPSEVCNGEIVEVVFNICAPIVPECISSTLITPNLELPDGWSIVGSNPSPFALMEGMCQSIAIQILVPASAPLGSIELISLNGTASGLCVTVDWNCEFQVTVINCNEPEAFVCPCGAGGLNIDASHNSPFYDAMLGGVPYSLLEAANNYDIDDNGYLGVSEHSNCIAILGRLIMDQNLSIACENVKMQPCSEIIVGTKNIHSTFNLNASTLYGCEIMWRGLTITPYAELILKGATFRDAQFAVTAMGSTSQQIIQLPTRFYSFGSNFIRNHVGVFIPTSFNETVMHAPFTGNTFKGKETNLTLLPPCDNNLPNHSEQIGYAGIVSLGTSFVIGPPGTNGIKNEFRDIRNGIIAENNAWIEVHRASFDNIPGYLTVFSNPNFNSSSGVGVLLRGGLSSVQNSVFKKVGHGLFSANAFHISALNNQMPDVYTGIQAEGPRGLLLNRNQGIGFRDWGIWTRNTIQIPGIPAQLQIKENHLSTIEADNDDLLEAGIIVGNSMNTGANTGALIKDNQILLKDVLTGIGLYNTHNWRVQGNTVIIDPHLLNLPQQGTTGITLNASTSNELFDNTFVSNSIDPNDSEFGIFAGIAPSNFYCDNRTVGTSIGAFFQGACDNTTLRTLTTDNHSNFALFCTPGTVISKQPDLDNFPIDNHSNSFFNGSWALHEGNIDQVRNSEFQVKTGVPTDHPSEIFLPGIPGGYDPNNPEWFYVSGNDLNVCVPPGGAGPPRRDEYLSETDEYFVSGDFIGSPFGDALNWEGRLRLYKRMRQYEGLSGVSTTVDAFYSAAVDGPEGAYAAIDEAIAQLYDIPSEWQTDMLQAWTAIENTQSQSAALLAGLAAAASWEDSVVIYRAAEAEKMTGLPAYGDLLSYGLKADSLRNLRASAAWVMNEALPATDMLQYNRKTVNRIYLETIGRGIYTLTTSQFTAVTPIAHQCPLEGGSAVYQARELYRLNESGHFDDALTCSMNNQQRSRMKQATGKQGEISIAPNPASEQVLISLENSALRPTELRIVGINGKTILMDILPAGSMIISVDVSAFPSGIYICFATNDTKSFEPVKFVVQR